MLLTAGQPVAGSFSGLHRSLLKGSAMEFAELRNYNPGDDLRRLDWKAYGRSDRYFLKEYESETNARVYFLIDSSGSMLFESRKGEKRLEYAKKVVATLAALYLYQGDSVSIVHKKDGYLQVPVYRGESCLSKVLLNLKEIEAGGGTSLGLDVKSLCERIPKRSIVFLLSDYLMDLGELYEGLQFLKSCAHEATLLQTLSERELDISKEDHSAFRDLESDVVIKTHVKKVKQEYMERLSAHQNELAKCAVKQNAEYYLFQQESDIEDNLQDYIIQRLDQK